MKTIYFVLILFLTSFIYSPLHAQQSGMFKQKKERKRMWRRWKPNREAYNPYLEKKGKDKPSAKASRANGKETRKQKKAYKRQLKKNKKSL